jgi:hypothetical protein
MRRTTARVLRAAAVGGLVALSASGCKDKEVRTYIEGDLHRYLDSLTREVCTARERDAQPENWLCETGDPDTYKPPPTNGKP